MASSLRCWDPAHHPPLIIAATLAAASFAPAALGQALPPDYDFPWATIGCPGNPPWTGHDPFNVVEDRGRVDYEYRISKLEVTTAQWTEFVNTFACQPELLQPGGPRFVWGPLLDWGAGPDWDYTGPGMHYRLGSAAYWARVPVIGISWRDAALFCNWLNNGKPHEWSAIQNGAYDASTFTDNPDGTFNDQPAHNPAAQFWISTLDEWLKAAHYDPNRYGPGLGGWWTYVNRSETPPVPGPPGVGQTNAGLQLPNFAEFDIPLGAYPLFESPWGLWDTSGGASEWTETLIVQGRVFDGSTASFTDPTLDAVWSVGTDYPGATLYGLRVASRCPTAGTSAVRLTPSRVLPPR